MLYGLNLAKAAKKFDKYKKFQKKQQAMERQKVDEKKAILDDFFGSYNQKLNYKTRILEKQTAEVKKKYYRQPKIYQNDYICELQETNKIKEYFTEQDSFDDEFRILYLFFIEKDEIFLLLGREKKKANSQQNSSDGFDSSLVDSDANSQHDVDDDSPYFVKITIDQWFLTHLEDPSIVDPSEIKGNYELIMKNPHFKDIITREIEMMFNLQKKPERKEESSVCANSVIQDNI